MRQLGFDIVRVGVERSLLVVDDDALVREVLCMTLRRSFSVESLNDGAGLVERCLARRFDAVLTDVRMPFDGISAVRELRRAGLATPVIFMTGEPEGVGLAVLAELAPALVVGKPCDGPRLRELLGRFGL